MPLPNFWHFVCIFVSRYGPLEKKCRPSLPESHLTGLQLCIKGVRQHSSKRPTTSSMVPVEGYTHDDKFLKLYKFRPSYSGWNDMREATHSLSGV